MSHCSLPLATVAKYQATQVDADLADAGILCAGIGGHPSDNMTWLALERDIPSDATSLRLSNLPAGSHGAPKPIYFSNLYDNLKAHLHS